MEYITKQKFSLRNIPFIGLYGTTIALAEPNPERAAIYRRHLDNVNAVVIEPSGIFQLPMLVKVHQPDALVINPFEELDDSLEMVKLITDYFPGMPVIAIGDPGSNDYLDAIMNAGVRAHLHPRFTRPKDLLVMLEKTLS